MSKDDYEHAINRLLQAQRRPLSTKRIATKTHMTWPTAKKYLNQMKTRGNLSTYRSNNRIYWKPVSVRGHLRHTSSGRTTQVHQHQRKESRKLRDL